MRTSVLITGGSGLLALSWALAIRDRYAVTLGLHERTVSLPKVESLQVDLASADRLAQTLDAIRPKLVIHTVGLTNIEKCEFEPDLARHVNVELAKNVAIVCAKYGVPLIHISTDHLFSGDQQFVDEISPTAPINVYGKTKAEAELRVLDAHPQSVVMRTNFYGWGPSYRRSFSDIVIDALRAGKEICLFQDVFYTPILIQVVAQAAHDLIAIGANGIYHVVGDERISKYTFGLKIADEFKLDSTLIKPGLIAERPSLVQRPHDMSLSNNKTCTLLGRKLGEVDEHIARLHRQEQSGLAREMQNL
jgi:dTDP-4-dehydrorhamnose reductase